MLLLNCQLLLLLLLTNLYYDNVEFFLDDEEVNKTAKLLASQTLKAVKWLYNNNRLTLTEKSILTNDIITNNANQEFSKVEIAYSLIIGPGKPEELLSAVSMSSEDFLSSSGSASGDRSSGSGSSSGSSKLSAKKNKNSDRSSADYGLNEEDEDIIANYNLMNNLSLIDMDKLDEDIITEFEDICHVLASEMM